MTSQKEKDKLVEIRADVVKRSEETRKALEVIQELFGPVGANNMHNVSIMFNNKLSEILNKYYKVGLEMFNDHFLNAVVFNYLIDAYIQCVNILDNIIKYLTFKKIFIKSNDPYVVEMINKYISVSEEIYAFNIEEDLDVAMFAYCVDKAKKGMIIDKDKAMEDMMPDLEKLGIDPSTIEGGFFNPKEMLDGIIKTLNKHINDSKK